MIWEYFVWSLRRITTPFPPKSWSFSTPEIFSFSTHNSFNIPFHPFFFYLLNSSPLRWPFFFPYSSFTSPVSSPLFIFSPIFSSFFFLYSTYPRQKYMKIFKTIFQKKIKHVVTYKILKVQVFSRIFLESLKLLNFLNI